MNGMTTITTASNNVYLVLYCCPMFIKNMNASKPSKYPNRQGGKLSNYYYLGENIGRKDKTSLHGTLIVLLTGSSSIE